MKRLRLKGPVSTRDRLGRWLPGCSGNPFARRVAACRAALMQAVTPKDMRAVVKMLVRKAKAGNLGAAHELLNRVVGRPIEADLIERLEALEQLIGEQKEREESRYGPR